MRKKEIFDEVSQIEAQMAFLNEQFLDLKSHLTKVVEENHRLYIENEHLKAILKDEQIRTVNQSGNGVEAVKKPNKAMENLEKIYRDGFHICHLEFGSPREEEGNCLFCMSLLNRS